MTVRPATATDLPEIVRLPAVVSVRIRGERLAPPPRAYAEAFPTIARQDGNQVLVAANPVARHRGQTSARPCSTPRSI